MLLGPQSVHLATDQATMYCRQNEPLVQCQCRTADASLAVPASRRWQTAAPPSLFQGFARMKSSAYALWDPRCDGLHGRPLEFEVEVNRLDSREIEEHDCSRTSGIGGSAFSMSLQSGKHCAGTGHSNTQPSVAPGAFALRSISSLFFAFSLSSSSSFLCSWEWSGADFVNLRPKVWSSSFKTCSLCFFNASLNSAS